MDETQQQEQLAQEPEQPAQEQPAQEAQPGPPDQPGPDEPKPLLQFSFTLLSNGRLMVNWNGPQAADVPLMMQALKQAGTSYLQKQQQAQAKRLVLPGVVPRPGAVPGMKPKKKPIIELGR